MLELIKQKSSFCEPILNRYDQAYNTRPALQKYRASHQVWSLPKNAGDLYKMEQTFQDYGIIILIYIKKIL
jgi:hypothetical protein